MSCILADKGETIISIDLSAGEPTVTAHFSRDQNYRFATFDGVGKRPFYKGDVLMLSDIYIMTMSVSPMGRKQALELYHTKFGSVPMPEQWLIDDDIVKKEVKKLRDFHKMLALGLGYGMGPKKCVKQSYEKGFSLSFEDSQRFYKAYWQLFKDVRNLVDALAIRIKRDGYVINPFGYRLTPPPHKGFNYFIQSSVSGIMHIFCWKLLSAAPYAKLITVIHDEALVSVPTHRIEEFRLAKEQATQSLNEDLQWSVAVRTGFVVGQNWYDAK